MLHTFSKIFGTQKKIIIGALHFAPLVDYPDYPGYDTILENALADLRAFEDGGVDAIIFENNYDIPHLEFVSPATMEMMRRLGVELKAATKLPLGVSVLWNDYKAAFQIALQVGLHFIRIPVFVDTVRSRYGMITADPRAIIEYQKMIGAEDVAMFTDIHVKHSEILSDMSLEESAVAAIEQGSSGLIITGEWTGEAPNITKLQSIRKAVGDFPIIIGSGARVDNIRELFKYADAVIVSTALKEGSISSDEKDNLKGWGQRISVKKVAEFVDEARA